MSETDFDALIHEVAKTIHNHSGTTWEWDQLGVQVKDLRIRQAWAVLAVPAIVNALTPDGTP